MRVTNAMVVRNYTRNLHSNRALMDRFSRQIQTGRRFETFSQDNASGVRAMQVRRNLARIDANIDNARASIGFMRSAESNLMSMVDIAHTVSERVVMALNGTVGASDRHVVANELERLRESILALANGQHAGRYTFGGTNTITPPFDIRDVQETQQVSIPQTNAAGAPLFSIQDSAGITLDPASFAPPLTIPATLPSGIADTDVDFASITMADWDAIVAASAGDHPDLGADFSTQALTHTEVQDAFRLVDNDGQRVVGTLLLSNGNPATIPSELPSGRPFDPQRITQADWDAIIAANPAGSLVPGSFEATLAEPRNEQLLHYNGHPVRDLDPNNPAHAHIFNDAAHVDVGTNITFNQDDPTRVDPGAAFRFTLRGIDFLGHGQENLMDTLTELITFFRNGDFETQSTGSQLPGIDNIEGSRLLDAFRARTAELLNGITQLGADASFAEFTVERLLDDQLNMRERQQDLEIREPDEAIIDFRMQEFVYNAILQMGQRLLTPTLFDFIR